MIQRPTTSLSGSSRMSRKPHYSDDVLMDIAAGRVFAYPEKLAMDLQRARAEARGRKKDQLRLRALLDDAVEYCITKTSAIIKHLNEVIQERNSCKKALKKITDPNLASLATAAQIAKEALKDE